MSLTDKKGLFRVRVRKNKSDFNPYYCVHYYPGDAYDFLNRKRQNESDVNSSEKLAPGFGVVNGEKLLLTLSIFWESIAYV